MPPETYGTLVKPWAIVSSAPEALDCGPNARLPLFCTNQPHGHTPAMSFAFFQKHSETRTTLRIPAQLQDDRAALGRCTNAQHDGHGWAWIEGPAGGSRKQWSAWPAARGPTCGDTLGRTDLHDERLVIADGRQVEAPRLFPDGEDELPLRLHRLAPDERQCGVCRHLVAGSGAHAHAPAPAPHPPWM